MSAEQSRPDGNRAARENTAGGRGTHLQGTTRTANTHESTLQLLERHARADRARATAAEAAASADRERVTGPGVAYRRMVDALAAAGRVKHGGEHETRATCPAHDGDGPSLAVRRGHSGVLVTCHSHQCTTEQVATAVGLTMPDLFDEPNRSRAYSYAGGGVKRRQVTTDGGKRVTWDRGTRPAVLPLWVPEAARTVNDPHGVAALAAAGSVHLAEGEKTAEALAFMGIDGCPASFGSTADAHKVDLAPLAGKRVTVWADRDEPGRKAAHTVAGRAIAAGAVSVQVQQVQGPHNDAADLWEAHGEAWAQHLPPAEPFTEPAASATHEEATTEAITSSWAPVPLADLVAGLVAGTIKKSAPTVLTRDDGAALFYRRKVNGMHGDSGSGKTFVMLLAALQVLEPGGCVVYIDLEDSDVDVVARLLALGAAPELVATRFYYVHPEERFLESAPMFLALVDTLQPALVVIDSTGESLAAEGKNPNADEDIAAWFQDVPKRIAARGPAVVVLDHMAKASDSDLWPIGSQRKRAAIDGAQYLLEATVSFAKDKPGTARMTCAKDRHGNYARGQRVGVLNITPNGDRVNITLEVPGGTTDVPGSFRPTGYMERVSRALRGAPEPLTYRGILERVEGKKQYIRDAVDVLVREGYVEAVPGPRNSTIHHSVKPFSENDDSGGTLEALDDPQPSVDCSRSLGGGTGHSLTTVPGAQSGNSGEQSVLVLETPEHNHHPPVTLGGLSAEEIEAARAGRLPGVSARERGLRAEGGDL